MPNHKVTQWKKWSLVIDDTQLTVPTKEHGVRLGRYLTTFGVPVTLIETALTISNESGQMKVVGKNTTDISHLLDETTTDSKTTKT